MHRRQSWGNGLALIARIVVSWLLFARTSPRRRIWIGRFACSSLRRVVAAYKSLAHVERAFRSMKTVERGKRNG
jgi:hypothetical protein